SATTSGRANGKPHASSTAIPSRIRQTPPASRRRSSGDVDAGGRRLPLSGRGEVRVGPAGAGAHFDLDAAIHDVGGEHVAFGPMLADRQLQAILDRPLQEAGAVAEAVAVLHQLLQRFRRDSEAPLAARQRALDLVNLLNRNLK